MCVLYTANSYRQGMVRRACVGVAFAAASIALAPALSACGGIIDTLPTKTVTATAGPTTTPTTSQLHALRAWRDATLVPAQEVRDAAGQIVKAGETFDLTSMGIACQEEKDAVEQFQQHMPSPDSEVNAPLQKALSDYSAAATICTTAVENSNFDDFKQAATLVDEANTYMDNALKILQADLEESPNSAPPPSASPRNVPAPATTVDPGSLAVSVPMSHPACDGTGIVVLGSAVTPDRYQADVQRMLAANPGASYLRTDESCSSLRQTTDAGNPIYAVYRVAGRTTQEVCNAVQAAGGAAYGKWLDNTTDPAYIIPCS